MKNTDDLPEGDANIYFTTMRARAAIANKKNGPVRYDNVTGKLMWFGDKKLEARVKELENIVEKLIKRLGDD